MSLYPICYDTYMIHMLIYLVERYEEIRVHKGMQLENCRSSQMLARKQ